LLQPNAKSIGIGLLCEKAGTEADPS